MKPSKIRRNRRRADPFGFKKLAKDIRAGVTSWSPEMLRLAEKAVQRQEEWNARRAKMTPEELKADDEAWAARLAADIGRFTD